MQVSRQLAHRSPKQLPARIGKYALVGIILVLALLAVLAWQFSGNLHTSASTAHSATHSLSQVAHVSPAVTPAATPSNGDPWPNP